MSAAQKPDDHQSGDFTHKFAEDKTVTLPRLKSVMTFGRSRRYRHLDDGEQMFLLIEEISDEKTLAVLDDMDADATEAFLKAWQLDSGVTPGESAGSSA